MITRDALIWNFRADSYLFVAKDNILMTDTLPLIITTSAKNVKRTIKPALLYF